MLGYSLAAPHLKRFTLQCYVTTIEKKLHSVCDPDNKLTYCSTAVYVTQKHAYVSTAPTYLAQVIANNYTC